MLIRMLVVLVALWSVQTVRWGPAYLKNHLQETRAFWTVPGEERTRVRFGRGWDEMVGYLREVPGPDQVLLFPLPVEGTGYFQFALASQIYPRSVDWTEEPERAPAGSYLFTLCGLPVFPAIPLHRITREAVLLTGRTGSGTGTTTSWFPPVPIQDAEAAEPGFPLETRPCGLEGFRLIFQTAHGVLLRREYSDPPP